MQEQIEASIGKVKARIANELGENNEFVKLGKRKPRANFANVRIEITLTVDYTAEGGIDAKHDDLIRNYMRNIEIKGTWSRAVQENEKTGQHEVVYKINLATAERSFGISGYICAKFDEISMDKDFAVAFVKNTEALIKAIDRKFKPLEGWAYADARVIEHGSSKKPETSYTIALPQQPYNIVSIESLREEQRAAKAREYLEKFGKADEGVLYIAVEKPEVVAAASETVAFNPRVAREALKIARTRTDLAGRDTWIDEAHKVAEGERGSKGT